MFLHFLGDYQHCFRIACQAEFFSDPLFGKMKTFRIVHESSDGVQVWGLFLYMNILVWALGGGAKIVHAYQHDNNGACSLV